VVAAAREIATRVLHRVLHDDAWAAPTLDAELSRAAVHRADAALGTQIVYGTLRAFAALEQSVAKHARRPVELDDWSRAALLGGAYQLLHLGRVPPHAAVHDTVELVRLKRGKRVAGFVNALLRKVAIERPDTPEPPTSLSVPTWLRQELVASLGPQRTEQLLMLGAASPSIDLRVGARENRLSLADAISKRHATADVEPTALSPVGLRVSGAGDPRALPGYDDGAFAVQEEGAQLIGLVLGAKPGERLLDACAGRGGKTAILVEALEGRGAVIATDIHEHRLDRISGELTRLRLDTATLQTACVDWTIGAGPVREPVDRVLVDAPCTGLGTLRRRPEILLRAKPGDAARMGEIQRDILRNASRVVRPGGTLLYAVCSPLSKEGPEVVRELALPGFTLLSDRASGLKSLRFDREGRLDLGPWVEGAGPWADAYQIHMWVHVG
jgi:16S rRNA (cytosine967-C5)-methyltransferase